MTKTVPIFAILAIGADSFCRSSPGVRLWHLIAGSLPAATSAALEIQNLPTSLTHWGHKPWATTTSTSSTLAIIAT